MRELPDGLLLTFYGDDFTGHPRYRRNPRLFDFTVCLRALCDESESTSRYCRRERSRRSEIFDLLTADNADVAEVAIAVGGECDKEI